MKVVHMNALVGHLRDHLTHPRQAAGSTVSELRLSLSKQLGRPVSENFIRRLLNDLRAENKLIREDVQEGALDGRMRWTHRYRLASSALPLRKSASSR